MSQSEFPESLGCEGDGSGSGFGREFVPGSLANYSRKLDEEVAPPSLRTYAQRALMALDNIADCPYDPNYFDSPHAWIFWAKKRAQDQAAELRAALAATPWGGAAERNKS